MSGAQYISDSSKEYLYCSKVTDSAMEVIIALHVFTHTVCGVLFTIKSHKYDLLVFQFYTTGSTVAVKQQIKQTNRFYGVCILTNLSISLPRADVYLNGNQVHVSPFIIITWHFPYLLYPDFNPFIIAPA